MQTKLLITTLTTLALFILLLPAAQADEVQLTLISVGNNSSCFGDYCDPYQLSVQPLNSSGNPVGNSAALWLNCDDYTDTIYVGNTWEAAVIAGSQDLSGTWMAKKNSWDATQAAIAYDEKAWIETYSSPANNPAYTAAIWAIFDPSNTGLANSAGTLLTDAQNYVLGNSAKGILGDGANDYSTWRKRLTIYSPVQAPWATTSTPQEFNTVPDGGLTIMLMGGVLVGLGTLRRFIA